jgi:four helix bundle protein
MDMFDFEKLIVYGKAKEYYSQLQDLTESVYLKQPLKNQLERASLSIILNIAEGSGRKTKPDKKNFMIIARGSVFECVAILDLLQQACLIDQVVYQSLYSYADELSRMLYSMIISLEQS